MTEQIQAPFTCAICNETIEGELTKKRLGDKEVDFTLDDTHTGYQCGNCSANICYPPKKHLGMGLVKFGLLKGWKKVLCPVCGELFMPGKLIVVRVAEFMDAESKKRRQHAYGLLCSSTLMKAPAGQSVLRSTLHDMGPMVFDHLLERIASNSNYEQDRQISHILALGRLVGIADTELRIPNIEIYDTVKVEQCLLGLTTWKGYKIRRYACQMLVRLEVKTGSGESVPHLIEKMLDRRERDHVRAAIAEELGLIKGDDRVIDGLRKALTDNTKRNIEGGTASVSDLFRSLPSVAELASESLKQIKSK